MVRMPMHHSTVVLLSGGLDSATCLAIACAQAKPAGHRVYSLSFDYNQRHRCELAAAERIAAHNSVDKHVTIPIDLSLFGGSALTDSSIAVPKHDSVEDLEQEIPATYVPARNLVFLSLATAYAESVGATELMIGVNAIDYSGYPDCRPAFIEAFSQAANLATKQAVEGDSFVIRTPLAEKSKAEIIRIGLAHNVDYSMTVSCYDPDEQGKACGRCDSCLLRAKGFRDAGVADPTQYQSGVTSPGALGR